MIPPPDRSGRAPDPSPSGSDPVGQSLAHDVAGLPPRYGYKPELEYTPRDFAGILARGRIVNADGDAGPGPNTAPRVLLIDVRTDPEVAFAAIPGAIHVPLDRLEQQAANLPLDEADIVGVLCHHGVRSLQGAMILRRFGAAEARSIAGGIESWSLAVDAKVPRYQRSGLTVTPA